MAEERVERRLAAILAADVAGYSRLTGADEEGTIARLRHLRRDVIDPTFADHRGRIVKTTGDGILAEFGSVVDAVRCAIAIQKGIALSNAGLEADRRLEFRIGINLGDVIVEGDDLLGDGINVAARLEGIATPGGITLSEAAFRQVEGKIDATFADLGHQTLKNIARAVRVFGIDSGAAPSAPEAVPGNASIAVLPFQNMSGDAEQEYFADGIVEDIITGLSRIKWLLVIARNSSFVFKGKTADVKQVARELGVRYVLEGSVRKAGNRVRITGQLIEAASGRHLWAERYDRALDDIFEVQDEITLNVLGAIEPNLRQAEIERVKRKRPENLVAYDLLLQGMALMATTTPADAIKAMGLMERALALAPACGGAHAILANCYRTKYLRGDGTDADRLAAIEHAHAELAMGCDDAVALAMVAFVIYQLEHDNGAASELFDRALALSPSSMSALGMSAIMLAWTGSGALAIERAERAIRLSPFDPQIFVPHTAIAVACFRDGRFAQAAEAARRAADANPQFALAGALQTASLVRAGRVEEAKAVMQRTLSRAPDIQIGEWINRAYVEFATFGPIIDAIREIGFDFELPREAQSGR